MDSIELEKLGSLITLLREQGVSYFKTEQLELALTPAAASLPGGWDGLPAHDDPDELTEQLLFHSSTK